MLKNTVADVGWGEGYVVSQHAPNVINGRLYQLIEALGLPEKQEESLKGLIQKEVWDVFQDAISISSERHSEIRNEHYNAKKIADGTSVPLNPI